MKTRYLLGVGVALFVIVVCVAGSLYYNWRFPCLKYETVSCEQAHCTVWDAEQGCLAWATIPATCTACVLRGDRKYMPTEMLP
jgi:hypothetical protein